MVELLTPADRVASPVILSPSQQKAAHDVIRGLKRGDCVVVRDSGSDGKTNVLATLAAYEPAAIEERRACIKNKPVHLSEYPLFGFPGE